MISVVSSCRVVLITPSTLSKSMISASDDDNDDEDDDDDDDDESFIKKSKQKEGFNIR